MYYTQSKRQNFGCDQDTYTICSSLCIPHSSFPLGDPHSETFKEATRAGLKLKMRLANPEDLTFITAAAIAAEDSNPCGGGCLTGEEE